MDFLGIRDVTWKLNHLSGSKLRIFHIDTVNRDHGLCIEPEMLVCLFLGEKFYVLN